ncbi:MAG: hypothetical protein AB8G11_01050 [Saprospiraceae bacterium]
MKNLLRISAMLWIIWGLVHVFAGIMTMKGPLAGDISASVSGIADAIEPILVQMDYSTASGAIIAQHGFNLFWIGIFTFIGAFYIWKGSKTAIIFTAIVGGLTDLGYFIFIDLGGFANFVPGTIMTIVSATAIILSLYVYFKTRNQIKIE